MDEYNDDPAKACAEPMSRDAALKCSVCEKPVDPKEGWYTFPGRIFCVACKGTIHVRPR